MKRSTRPVAGAGGARLEVVRVAVGVVEILFAYRLARAELGRTPDGGTVGAFRVLGVRQIVQGLLTRRSDSDLAHALGGATDTLHALSMVVLGSLDSPRRRAAGVQGTLAALLATAEFTTALRHRR